MPLIGITNEGIEIAVSPTVVSVMNPIIICGVIALLFMCFKKIYESKVDKVQPTDDDHHLGEVPEWTKLEVFLTLFAIIAIITSITTVLITTSRIVTLDCVFGLLIPPYAAFQAQKCTELKAMEEELEVRKHEMDNLEHENSRLEEAKKKYVESVTNLKSFADVFEEVKTMSAVSLDQLEDQLKNKQEILKSAKDEKMDMVLDNIFSILINADDDSNSTLSDHEIEILIKKIEGIESVDIDDKRARKMIISAGRGLHAVMKLVEDLLRYNSQKGKSKRNSIIRIL